MPAYTIQNTIKGPFTKDVRGEGSRGFQKSGQTWTSGGGGGSYSTTRTSEFKKNKNKKHICFCGIKRY